MVANPKTLYVSCKFTLVDFKKADFVQILKLYSLI